MVFFLLLVSPPYLSQNCPISLFMIPQYADVLILWTSDEFWNLFIKLAYQLQVLKVVTECNSLWLPESHKTILPFNFKNYTEFHCTLVYVQALTGLIAVYCFYPTHLCVSIDVFVIYHKLFWKYGKYFLMFCLIALILLLLFSLDCTFPSARLNIWQ